MKAVNTTMVEKAGDNLSHDPPDPMVSVGGCPPSPPKACARTGAAQLRGRQEPELQNRKKLLNAAATWGFEPRTRPAAVRNPVWRSLALRGGGRSES
jgi:hypothetical protein